MDGWMDFVSPGGKGPWDASYIRVVHFALVSFKTLRFSSINVNPCLFCWLWADRLGGYVLQVFRVLSSAAKAGTCWLRLCGVS